VLAGVDAQSTYCYLLAAEQHRDADTWGMHLLDAAKQGLQPDDTIADAGQGLTPGRRATSHAEHRQSLSDPHMPAVSTRPVSPKKGELSG